MDKDLIIPTREQKERYTNSFSEAYRSMYYGMGYYLLVAEKIGSADSHRYYIQLIEGSNGYDREVSYKDFMALTPETVEWLTWSEVTEDLFGPEDN